MSLEIEKKYRLEADDLERVKSSLAGLGAEFIGREFEENVIFSGQSLREIAAVVRIRTTDRRVILTYKRRVPSEFDVKTQVEHEVEISDAGAATSILAELGLTPWLLYEKYRDTWQFKSVEIVLDELPFGLFMEIEGAVTGIREAEELLEIENLDVEHETYPALTARLGSMVGDVTEARFNPKK